MAAAALVFAPVTNVFANAAEPKVKIAIMGVGARGVDHLEMLLGRADVDVVAICEIEERALNNAKALLAKSGKKMPQVFTGDTNAWKKMLEIKGGIDGVIIATPWELHKPMIIGALEAGVKYVGSEVIIGITLQDHWDVVKAAEKYNGHVMMIITSEPTYLDRKSTRLNSSHG